MTIQCQYHCTNGVLQREARQVNTRNLCMNSLLNLLIIILTLIFCMTKTTKLITVIRQGWQDICCEVNTFAAFCAG